MKFRTSWLQNHVPFYFAKIIDVHKFQTKMSLRIDIDLKIISATVIVFKHETTIKEVKIKIENSLNFKIMFFSVYY